MPKTENRGLLKKDLAKWFNNFLFVITSLDLYDHLIVL